MRDISVTTRNRLNVEDWPKSPEWRARRLCFIWLMMYDEPRTYRELIPEKNDFYFIKDNEVDRYVPLYYNDYKAISTGVPRSD